MNDGKYVFPQVVDFFPRYQFDKAVKKYNGDYRTHGLSCYNQFLHLLFGQLTCCSSLRDICLCLDAHRDILYHLGFRNTVNQSSLSRANDRRDYRIFEEVGYYLIREVRLMYANTQLADVSCENAIYALDSTTISVSIKLATWALGKYGRGAVKMHTLLDLRGSIPTEIFVTDGRCHDSNALCLITLCASAIYVADKAYLDFGTLYRIHQSGAYFILRPKRNTRFEVVDTKAVGSEASNIVGDCAIRLTGAKSRRLYPASLRLVRAVDPESGEIVEFITNNMEISAQDVASIYRHRWDIEVFFKWIKQNLDIKTLWGYSENAVKTHLWVAIIAYLLMAKIKATLKSDYTITEIATLLSVSALERRSLCELLTKPIENKLNASHFQQVKELQLDLFN